ncbi:Rep protein [Listeria monocytogenes]|nr:Rep protein [Listeria monocytogenes]
MKKGELLSYNTKIIDTPTTKEIWIYDEPIFSRAKSDNKNITTNINERQSFDNMSAVNQYDSLKRKQKHYEEMRWEVARLVDCNFDNMTKFLTLTFKENHTDIAYTNKEFEKFIKRLNYHLYKSKKQVIKYLATWEKQKRGAIHYHVIFFYFPYIKNKELERVWGHGFIKINKIDVDSKDNRGRYVSKYFSKDLELKEHKKKAFFKSQNLKMPRVRKTILTDEMIETFNRENIIFIKHYNRKFYDRLAKITNDNGEEPRYILKDSKVTYIKIKK